MQAHRLELECISLGSGSTAAAQTRLLSVVWGFRLLAHVADQRCHSLRARRPSCAFLLSIRMTFSSEQTLPCGLKGL